MRRAQVGAASTMGAIEASTAASKSSSLCSAESPSVSAPGEAGDHPVVAGETGTGLGAAVASKEGDHPKHVRVVHQVCVEGHCCIEAARGRQSIVERGEAASWEQKWAGLWLSSRGSGRLAVSLKADLLPTQQCRVALLVGSLPRCEESRRRCPVVHVLRVGEQAPGGRRRRRAWLWQRCAPSLPPATPAARRRGVRECCGPRPSAP